MSGQQEEDKKHGDQSVGHINLKVNGQDGNEVFFRIKRCTQLKKLMNAYCDQQFVDFNSPMLIKLAAAIWNLTRWVSIS
ncbi:hypothetical protein REPUB_Repub18cG0163800 [Reevesia pubescens]